MLPSTSSIQPQALPQPSASTKYSTVDEFVDAVRADREGTLDDLLTYYNGNFRLGDGRRFQVHWVDRRGVQRLTVKRRYDADAAFARRALDGVVDALWSRSAPNRLRASVERISAGMFRRIENDMLTTALPVIQANLLGKDHPTLEASVQAADVAIGSESIVPWLNSDTPANPFRRDNLIDTTLKDNILLARYRHNGGALVLRFVRKGREHSATEGTSLGQRDLQRLERLIKAKTAPWSDVPPYENARQLMTQFVRMRLEEETPELLRLYARGQQHAAFGKDKFPECGDLRYPLLPHGAGIYAGDGDMAIEEAIRAVSQHIRQESKRLAQACGANPALVLHPGTTTVDRFTNRALGAVQAAAREAMQGHDRKSFRAALLAQIAVEPAGGKNIKGLRDDGFDRKGRIGKNKVVEKDVANGDPSVAVLQMQTRIRFPESVLHILLSKLPKRGNAPAERQPRVIVGERDVVRVVDVHVKRAPEMLRFPLPSPDRQKPTGWEQDCVSGRPAKYKNINGLLDAWYLTVYDNHMHTDVLPKVRSAIDASVAAMREEADRDLRKRLWKQLDDQASAARDPLMTEHAGEEPFVASIREPVLALQLAKLRLEAAEDAAKDAHSRLAAWGDVEARTKPGYERAYESAVAACNAAQAAVTDLTNAWGQCRQALEGTLRTQVRGENIPSMMEEIRSGIQPAGEWGLPRTTAKRIAIVASAIREAAIQHVAHTASLEQTLRDRMQNLRIGNCSLSELQRWHAAEVDYGLAVREGAANQEQREEQNEPASAPHLAARGASVQILGIPPEPVGKPVAESAAQARDPRPDATVYESVDEGVGAMLWAALNPLIETPQLPNAGEGEPYSFGRNGLRPMSEAIPAQARPPLRQTVSDSAMSP